MQYWYVYSPHRADSKHQVSWFLNKHFTTRATASYRFKITVKNLCPSGSVLPTSAHELDPLIGCTAPYSHTNSQTCFTDTALTRFTTVPETMSAAIVFYSTGDL